jgi:MFS family permease
VTSTAAGPRLFSSKEHFEHSFFWLATNFLWGALILILVPSQIKELAGANKGPMTGLTISIGAIAALVIPLVVGPISDRCMHRLGRRRPFIFAGVLINLLGVAALFVSGLAGNIHAYIASYFVITVGNNIATAAYSGVIPDLVLPEQRGEASGYMAVMSQVGTLLGAIAAGFTPKADGHLWAYAALAVVLVLGLFVSMRGIVEQPLGVAPAPIDWKKYHHAILDPLRNHDFRWVWITRALVMAGFYSFTPLIQYFLADVIKVPNPEQVTPQILMFVIVFAAVSGIVGGRLSDRVGRKRIVFISNLAMAIICLGFIFCREVWNVMAVGALFGLAYGAYISVDWALGTDVLPSIDDAAKDMGVWHISMTLPQALASYPAGLIAASFGVNFVIQAGEKVPQYTTVGYAAVFVLAAILCASGAFLLKNVRGST